MNDPWDEVIEFLNRPSNYGTTVLSDTAEDVSSVGALLHNVGGSLQAARRRQWNRESKLKCKSTPTPNHDTTSTNTEETEFLEPAHKKHKNEPELDLDWAKELLSRLFTSTSPNFVDAAKVWRLSGEDLKQVCNECLSLDDATAPATSELIGFILSDPAIGLENQTFLLKCISKCKWFTGKDETPAIIQSQLSEQLQKCPLAVIPGFLLPLIKKANEISQPTTSMLIKLVKGAKLTLSTYELFVAGLGKIIKLQQQALPDGVWQVMEALIVIAPSEMHSVEITKIYTEIIQTAAPANGSSKKFGIFCLHFINKLGGHLNVNNLDHISEAVSTLQIPLKKAILSAVSRKRKQVNSEK